MKQHSLSQVARAALPVLLTALVGVCATSCSGDKFGKTKNPPRLVVTLDAASKTGTREAPLDLVVDAPVTFRASVQAFTPDGALDTSFNRYVRVSTKPGAIDPLSGADTDGRNVLLRDGQSAAVDVTVTNAYGITYVVADDLGYTPVDPMRDPPPACANGIDDDGDGTVDFPADSGCAFANDDDEAGGTFTQGVSAPIFFRLPRIADVRGMRCEPNLGCSGNGRTPYPRQPISIDTGVRDDGSFAFDTVVVRISSDGFYATDRGDRRGTPPGTAGFTSLFAFNYSAPPRMRTCDRLKTFGGTANEFFGFTQMSFPTWTLEEWDPSKRPCLVPDPELLTPTTIASAPELVRRSGGLVRVGTFPDGSQKAMVTPKFGPGDVQKTPGGAYAPTAEVMDADGKIVPATSNCDFDKNGKITFEQGNPENDCATACTADPECTEWSNYAARSTFRITVTDSNGKSGAVQADASASAGFDPVAMRGVPLRHFAGTLHYFSGGAQFTIEARCQDDIIVSLEERPFISDTGCTSDDQCTEQAGLPPDFRCLPLLDGAKACRKPDPYRPDVRDPPPLACVFPRTVSENNPQ